jgi:hypothetical protein
MNLKSLYVILILFPIIKEVEAQIYSAEIIKYSTLCEVSTNRVTQTDSITIQINSRTGEEYTKISIPYSKSDKVSDLDAWIENMDGVKVRSLKKSEVVDKSAFSGMYLYADHFEKTFQLKHNVYPYKVVYTYKTSESDYITITRWTPIIYRTIPTLEGRLKVVVPRNFKFNQFSNNIPEAKVDSTKSDVVLEWKASYLKPIKREIYSQPENKAPLVVISPLTFWYGVNGSLMNWESYGNWQYRLIKGLDDLPQNEKNTISSMIKGITDKKEIVKVLYHYLQDHTRYINVSIKLGGLKPYPASYVAENKYGDCKALSNYMRAMLNFAGIESFYVNVNASEQPRDLIKNFYGPQFNHAIVAVPLEKDTIWLENTLNTNPFGFMGTFTQNKEALIITEKESKLVRVPALKKEDNLVSYKLEFDININGQAQVSLHDSFKGEYFELFNHYQSDFNNDERDKIIREYMPFDNYEVVNWELKKLHRDTARIELQAKLNLYKYLKPLGNEYYFSLYSTRIPSFTPVADRILPVVLPYPVSVSDTLIYNIPAGYELKTKLDPILIKSIYGNYEMKLNVINGKINAIKRFDLFRGTYENVQYPEFYSFIQSVKEKDKLNLIIKPIN